MADSVALGGFSLLLAVVGTGAALAERWRLLSSVDSFELLGAMMCGAPVVALVNLLFVRRDRETGRKREASVGLAFTLLAVVIGWLPILMVD